MYLLIPPPLDALPNDLSVSTRLPSLPDLEASRFRASQEAPIQFGVKPTAQDSCHSLLSRGALCRSMEYSYDRCCISDDVGHRLRLFPSAWHCA